MTASKPGQTQPRFSHPLLVTVVGGLIAGGVAVGLYLRSQTLADRHQVDEFYGIVRRMEADLSSSDSKAFWSDAEIFRTAITEKKYSDVLGTNVLAPSNNMDLLVDTADEEVETYLRNCADPDPDRHASPPLCGRDAAYYIEPSLRQLDTALGRSSYHR